MSLLGFQKYRRMGITEMRPYIVGEKLPDNVSISEADRKDGCPKAGDYIARNPDNHKDQWLINGTFFVKQQFQVVE